MSKTIIVRGRSLEEFFNTKVLAETKDISINYSNGIVIGTGGDFEDETPNKPNPEFAKTNKKMCETRLFNIKKESGIEPGDEVIFKLLTHAAGTWCRLYVEHLYKVEEYDDISYTAVKQKESVCLLSEEDMKTVLN